MSEWVAVVAVVGVGVFLAVLWISSNARSLAPKPVNMVPDPKATVGAYGIWNRDGIPWDEAPLPPKHHKCKAWTVTKTPRGTMEHCPCGGDRLVPDVWLYQNKRRGVVHDYGQEAERLGRWAAGLWIAAGSALVLSMIFGLIGALT